jgi:hypothetical protein
MPEADVARIISENLNGIPNRSKHLMTQLGWRPYTLIDRPSDEHGDIQR